MPFLFSNEYEYLYCETLSFYGNTAPIPDQYCASFDAFDLMETHYNSSNKYNGQTLFPAVTMITGGQYHNNYTSKPFIASRLYALLGRTHHSGKGSIEAALTAGTCSPLQPCTH